MEGVGAVTLTTNGEKAIVKIPPFILSLSKDIARGFFDTSSVPVLLYDKY